MPKLLINRGNFRVKEVQLEHGTLAIGRESGNHIVIQDSSVSGKHANIVTVFGASYVEDLASTNGTFVNGRKIQKHTLRHGDVVTVGNHQILFESADDTPAADAGPERTMVLNRDQLEALIASRAQTRSTSENAVSRSPAAQPIAPANSAAKADAAAKTTSVPEPPPTTVEPSKSTDAPDSPKPTASGPARQTAAAGAARPTSAQVGTTPHAQRSERYEPPPAARRADSSPTWFLIVAAAIVLGFVALMLIMARW